MATRSKVAQIGRAEADKRSRLLKRLSKRGLEVDHAFVRMLWVGDDPKFETFQLKLEEVDRITRTAMRSMADVLDAAELEGRRRWVAFDLAVRFNRPLSTVSRHFESAYASCKDEFCAASSLIGAFANHLKTQPPSAARENIARRLLELSEAGKSARKVDAQWFGEASTKLKRILKVR